MPYGVMKQNVKSSRRTYSTSSALVRACVKAGAVSAEVKALPKRACEVLVVKWLEGEREYPIQRDGTVDYQLAWDLS